MEYISKVLKLKKKIVNPELYIHWKYFFLNEGKVKTFPDTWKAELIHSQQTCAPAIVKVLQTKGMWLQTETWIYTRTQQIFLHKRPDL